MTTTSDRTDDPSVEPYPQPRAEGCPFDPPPALEAWQQEGPPRRVRTTTGSEAWLVTSYDDQRALLADPRVSSDITNPGHPSYTPQAREGIRASFILMDDPDHRRLRSMVTAPFAVRRIRAMRPAIQRIVDELIDRLEAGPRPVDLVEAFALPVPSLVICSLLGVPYEDHDFFQANSRELVRRVSTDGEREAANRTLTDYLTALVERKRVEPGDDVLSELAARVDDDELSAVEAARIGVLLLVAGHETTANMIALGTAALLEHPDQLAVLRDGDEAAVRGAVEELLRYLHITHNGRSRVALEDLEVAGTTVRAGEGLILAGDAGNRDPEVFDHPDDLDVTRDARHHLAFGFGIHQCLGQNLARVELEVVYGTLYRRLPGLRLAVGIDEVSFKHEAAVYGVHELPVTW